MNWLKRLKRRVKEREDLSLAIGEAVIRLPADHGLPEYLQKYQNYDRFLPAIARQMAIGSWIIDIGANCGDSLAAMAATNPALNFLCLEADVHFFRYLELNVAHIRAAYPTLGRVLTVRSLVGTIETSGTLIGEKGTRHLSASDDGERATPLEIIARDYLPPNAVVSLIKVDVDGLDYDVIRSAGTLLEAKESILYFECHFVEETQKTEYLVLFADLKKRGYSTFWLFDNFGAPVITTTSLDVISSLFEYVWLQTQGFATRTIFYFDVLASTPKSVPTVHKVLGNAHPHY